MPRPRRRHEAASAAAAAGVAAGRVRGERRATSPCASAVFVAGAGAVRGRRPRRARRRSRDACTSSALVDGAVGGAVRLYPLGEPGLWKGDRLAVLPEAAHGAARRPTLVRFAVRDRGRARRATRMVAHDPAARTCASSSASAGARTARRRALPRRHAPADGHRPPLVQPPRPVSGSPAQVPDGGLRRRRARAAARAVSSKPPQTARGQAAARERRAGRVGVLRRRGEHEAEARERTSQRSSGAPSRARQRVEVERARRSRPARCICSSEPATPGIETSRAACAEPALGDLDERVAVVAQPLGRAVVQRAEERPRLAHVPALERERGEQRVARARGARRAAGRARRRCRRPTAPAGRRASGARRRRARRAGPPPRRCPRARARRARGRG